MKFYFCTTSKKFGDSMILYPRVPKTLDIKNENDKIKRICVSNSILGCLSFIGNNIFINSEVNIYYCDINDMNMLYQPTIEEVNDVEYTGEFWLLKEQKFIFLKTIIINEHYSFDLNDIKINLMKFKEEK